MVNMDQIKGKINQVSGDLTDDQMQKLKGHIQESIGNSKESGEGAMEKISREVNEMIDRFKKENKDTGGTNEVDDHTHKHHRDTDTHTDRMDI